MAERLEKSLPKDLDTCHLGQPFPGEVGTNRTLSECKEYIHVVHFINAYVLYCREHGVRQTLPNVFNLPRMRMHCVF